jgi:Domain of unknown function (DUF4340)
MKARAVASPIVLVVLAAAAVTYAYLIDRGTVSDADREGRKRDVFPSFRASEVSRVEVAHAGESFVLERDGRGAASFWIVTARGRERADPAAIDVLLRELELATRVREVGDATPLLGLDEPRASCKVGMGPLEYRFAVGADAPRPEGSAYMRVQGEGVFVIGRSLKAQLLRPADAYRDHTLVSLGAAEVARLEVRARDGHGFVLERHGATFRVAGPELRASRAAVERVFAALADARADSFLDDRAAIPSMSAAITLSLVPIALTDAGRPAVELRIGGPCPGQPEDVVVVWSAPPPETQPRSACTAKALVDALAATPESLLDRAPLFAHGDEIEQIRLESLAPGGAAVDIARKGEGWHERSPEDRDLDAQETDSANGLALALANDRSLDAHRAPPDDRFGPRARATIVRTGGGTTEVLELGATGPDGVVPARRLDDGAILALPRAVARRFEPHAVALRAAEVWRPSFDPAAVVAVDDGCASAPQRLELHDGSWTMPTPRGFIADALSVTDLIGAIAHAKADAWIAERDDGAFGFDRPSSCTVTLTLMGVAADAGARSVSLAFGSDGEGGTYARTFDDPAVFVAPAFLRTLASRSDVDRNPLRLDPSVLTTVTLARGAARLILARTADRLVREDRENRDAGDDERLETALAGFAPEAAIHTGPPAREEGMAHPTMEITAKIAGADSSRRETRIAIGAATREGEKDFFFARASNVDATFVVPRRAVTAILDAW